MKQLQQNQSAKKLTSARIPVGFSIPEHILGSIAMNHTLDSARQAMLQQNQSSNCLLLYVLVVITLTANAFQFELTKLASECYNSYLW